MPHLPRDTSQAYNAIGKEKPSRSLRLTRYAEPDLAKGDRGQFFKQAFKSGVATPENHAPLVRWMAFLTGELGIPRENLVFGKLLSRLALHLSGGVMENAGILLDRFGYPYIPGSGVKGIARRAGLFALREWTQSNTKPQGADNPIAELCKDYSDVTAFAADLLRVFGWVEQDWKEGNDITWALSEKVDLLNTVINRLFQLPGVGDPATLRKSTRKGEITFLEARPVNEMGIWKYPKEGNDLELDVLTPHHQKYYAGKTEVALDIEEPIPVVFPTVAAGIVFVFAVKASAGAQPGLETLARSCLKTGITTFGVGAKTSAGYGWFAIVSNSGNPLKNPTMETTTATHTKIEETDNLRGDYTEKSFQRAVIDRLDSPGTYDLLKQEIPKLQKPENAGWLAQLKSYLSSPQGKRACTKLREKDFFPKEWLPKG